MVTSLYENLPQHFYLGCGVYQNRGGREEWTGESLAGEIPYVELLRWAYRKGFVQFERRHDARSEVEGRKAMDRQDATRERKRNSKE